MELLLDSYRAYTNIVARLSKILIKTCWNMLICMIKNIMKADVACRLQIPHVLCLFFFHYSIKIPLPFWIKQKYPLCGTASKCSSPLHAHPYASSAPRLGFAIWHGAKHMRETQKNAHGHTRRYLTRSRTAKEITLLWLACQNSWNSQLYIKKFWIAIM